MDSRHNSRRRVIFSAIMVAIMAIIPACHRHAVHGHSAAEHHMHRQNFDELVKHFEDPARDAWQKPKAVMALVSAHLKQQKVKAPVVADLGAGTGYFSFRLLDAGYTVKALDLDDKFIAYMKDRAAKHARRAQFEVRQASAESANLNDGEADVILSVDVYHHIENRVAYFARLKQSLRGQTALLMIIDFKDGDVPIGPPAHIKVPTAQIAAELREAGYTVTTDATTLPHQMIFFATPGK